MGFREDAVNAFRRSFLPQIHYLLQGTFGGYAVSHTSAEEYVLTTDCSEADLEKILAELGFSRNPIAALKVRTDGNTAEGSWVWRSSPLASYQLHIVLHDLENETGVDVYAHWECSWIRHPYNHYVARGYDAEKGVELARRWLEQYDGDVVGNGSGLEYEIDTSLERRLSESLSLSYYQLEELSAGIRDRISFSDGDSSKVDDRDGQRDDVSPRITDDV